VPLKERRSTPTLYEIFEVTHYLIGIHDSRIGGEFGIPKDTEV